MISATSINVRSAKLNIHGPTDWHIKQSYSQTLIEFVLSNERQYAIVNAGIINGEFIIHAIPIVWFMRNNTYKNMQELSLNNYYTNAMEEVGEYHYPEMRNYARRKIKTRH